MTFLTSILERKTLEAAALPDVDPKVSERSIVDALRERQPALIAEVKPASPSQGALLSPSRLPSVVRAYNKHAQAISVLCDHEAFGGSYELLAAVRTMTDLPILAKEFIVDRKQIRMARHAGADAILLIAAMVTKKKAQELSEEACALGMCVLFEIHEHRDITMVPTLPPDALIIGINNRNLNDLTIDLHTTTTLAPTIRSLHPETLLISESGIEREDDVRSLGTLIDAFLIGTTFLKSTDPAAAILSLFPEKP